MVTVRELTKYLSNIKEELQDKEIKIISENDLVLNPEIKYVLKDHSLDKTKDNVEYLIIT